MIRKARIFRICLFVILLSSCNIMHNDNHTNSEKIIEKNSESISVTENTESSFTGIYKYDYDYETDSKDLIEDHYIVLEIVNEKLQGRYYGTSDEFDEVREGYYPAFFVADMKKLKILDNEITFSIEIKESDLFSKAINTKYKTGEEISLKENPRWVNAHMIEGNKQNPRNYKGRIVGEEILLEVEYGPRVFKRVN
ncbi:hypothetical protein [Marinisporobacter balticus]|uniref:Uncharacterized protein n=1 Tax=Marinisporobacter balticus TaxID=2018667 RepID=A0A4R2K824_9FIRM|nr:hypothetical protein [Marinisporobacter balticus]TCO68057.1 hypothetical protein EV214_1507 [Marinisporobacter balticus]